MILKSQIRTVIFLKINATGKWTNEKFNDILHKNFNLPFAIKN